MGCVALAAGAFVPATALASKYDAELAPVNPRAAAAPVAAPSPKTAPLPAKKKKGSGPDWLSSEAAHPSLATKHR